VRNIRVDDRNHYWSQWVAAICTAVNDYAAPGTGGAGTVGILNLSLGIRYTVAAIVVAAAGNTGNSVSLTAFLKQ
jgi:hypothetical protein